MSRVNLWIIFALTAWEGHVLTAPSADVACRTPKGEEGRCVDVRSCPTLLRIVAKIPLQGAVVQVPTPDTEQGKEVQYVKDSRCQGKHEYSVCCAFQQEPDCGYMPESRLLGGSIPELDAFPWTAIVQHTRDNLTRQVCGGSLLNQRYVLTAARCLQADQNTRSSVVLGEIDRSTVRDCVTVEGGGIDCADEAVTVAVERTVPHPEYDATTGDNDVALLRLKEDVKYSDFIHPICLPTSDANLVGEKWLRVAGWGMNPEPRAGAQHMAKHQAWVTAITAEECEANIKGSRLGANRVCTKGQVGSTKQPVDVGGALGRAASGVYLDRYRVEAVAAALADGDAADGVTVYARVHPHVAWIREQIGQ